MCVRCRGSRSVSTEAPTGFDNLTNGFVDQATYDADRVLFERRFGLAQGLGPVYNARACGECHNHPITGGASQVSNLRAGRFNGSAFIAHPGGTLIGDRSTDPAFQEHVLDGNNVARLPDRDVAGWRGLHREHLQHYVDWHQQQSGGQTYAAR